MQTDAVTTARCARTVLKLVFRRGYGANPFSVRIARTKGEVDLVVTWQGGPEEYDVYQALAGFVGPQWGIRLVRTQRT